MTVVALGSPGQTVSYRYKFEKFDEGTQSFPAAFTVSSSSTTITRNLKPGTYRVRYRAVINGQNTKFSAASRSRKVR